MVILPKDYVDWPENITDNNKDYDIEDIDCDSCGLKFWVRPSTYKPVTNKEWPKECPRCLKGLPPLYEY